MTLALSCRDLWVELDGVSVLRGVSLDVPAGAWLGLIGPNGAGKTTLLRAVAGVVRARGEVLVAGRAVGGMSRRMVAQSVAVVPQDPVVPAGMSVLDYVLLGRTPHISLLGWEGPSDVRIALDLLERLDLSEMAGRRLGSLSGGERRRAILARALAQQAPLLLLDEPTASLDLGHQQQVLELVDRMRRREGIGVLSAMHDLTLAAQYAERLVLLDGGEVVAAGAAGEVLTPEALARRYRAEVSVLHHPDAGLVVAPRRARGQGLTSSAPADTVGSGSV